MCKGKTTHCVRYAARAAEDLGRRAVRAWTGLSEFPTAAADSTAAGDGSHVPVVHMHGARVGHERRWVVCRW